MYVQEFCPRMFPLRSARDTDDVTLRQTYVITNWIHCIGFPDFRKTSESHPMTKKRTKIIKEH